MQLVATTGTSNLFVSARFTGLQQMRHKTKRSNEVEFGFIFTFLCCGLVVQHVQFAVQLVAVVEFSSNSSRLLRVVADLQIVKLVEQLVAQ